MESMQKKNKIWLSVCIIVLLFIVAAALLYSKRQSEITLLPTYFHYTETELASFKNLKSVSKLEVSSLEKWDALTFDLVRTHLLGDIYAGEVYASLYTAQRDAAFIAYNQKSYFAISIDAVSRGVLCLYFAADCANLPTPNDNDLYSKKIADLVLTRIQERRNVNLESDKNLYPEKVGAGYWAGIKPYYGQAGGNWQPWLVDNIKHFTVPPPPAYDSAEEKNQLDQTKNALDHATEKQKLSIVYWAGGPGTITPLGIWLQYANGYMIAQQVSLKKMLLVRSVLTMGMADAGIACYNTKYTYWASRPFMLDKAIVSIMPTPNHPSYPSGHATFSGAAETILTYYFPENKAQWVSLANEASDTRIWSGIHFPIDASAGMDLGIKVGDAVIHLENVHDAQ